MRQDDDLRAARAFVSWFVYAVAFWTVLLVVALMLGAWSRTARGAEPTAIVTTRGYSDAMSDSARVRVFRYTGGLFTMTVDGDGIFRAGFEASKVGRAR